MVFEAGTSQDRSVAGRAGVMSVVADQVLSGRAGVVTGEIGFDPVFNRTLFVADTRNGRRAQREGSSANRLVLIQSGKAVHSERILKRSRH